MTIKYLYVDPDHLYDEYRISSREPLNIFSVSFNSDVDSDMERAMSVLYKHTTTELDAEIKKLKSLKEKLSATYWKFMEAESQKLQIQLSFS